jgi:hypothetical protein
MISFDQFKYQKKCITTTKKEIILEKELSKATIINNELLTTIKEDIQVAIPVVEIPQKQIENVSYIYLIREREHYLNNKSIYKFGRSTQLPDHKINRLYHYKKGSEIVMVLQCKNVIDTENKIRILFKQQFIQHIDGHEHYYGDVNIMKKIIWDVINT